MKRRIHLAWQLSAAALLLTVLAGCIGVDYVGQDFPPLPDEHQVQFFDGKNPPPAGEYQPIGRTTLTVPRGYDNVLIREKLAEVAREHGASAVKIVSVEQRLVNRYYADNDESDSPMLAGRDTTGALYRRDDGSPSEINSFGQVVDPNRTYRKEYERIVKALVLMTTQDHRRAVAERQRAAQEK